MHSDILIISDGKYLYNKIQFYFKNLVIETGNSQKVCANVVVKSTSFKIKLKRQVGSFRNNYNSLREFVNYIQCTSCTVRTLDSYWFLSTLCFLGLTLFFKGQYQLSMAADEKILAIEFHEHASGNDSSEHHLRNLMDDIERRVETMREQAISMEQEKEAILATLQKIQDNDLNLELPEGT